MSLHYIIKNIMCKTKHIFNTSKLINRKEPILTESKVFTKKDIEHLISLADNAWNNKKDNSKKQTNYTKKQTDYTK